MAPDSNIYAEFFGVSSRQITFDDLPNTYPEISFCFIVSSAVDSQGDGNFTAGWYPTFNAQTIADYKKRHPKQGSDTESNTKFILSITSNQFKGGAGWIVSATTSIKVLIDPYTFDGIDICFSSIDTTISEADFANLVAELIKRLRQQEKKKFIVSISPTPAFDNYYQKLYNKLQSDKDTEVDFVNYRFYDLPQTPPDLRTIEKAIVQVKEVKYPGAKVLVGNKTNPQSNGKINDSIFFPAYEKVPGLHGIFGWAADESPTDFPFEKEALEVLAKTPQV